MDRPLFDIYDSILIDGLKSALGCTEPIAIAFAAATARAALGRMPERLSVECSGNIVKNVKGVTVPNSGGMKGIEVAAILGAVGGDETKALEVLSSIKDEDIATTRELLKAGICSVTLAEGVPGLYISIKAEAGDESAEATIIDCHNEICSLKKNGKIIFKHALRNALIPVITYLGPQIAFTLCGGFVVETVFTIPGLGRYFVQSITNRDYPLIMGTTIFLAAFIIIMNLVVDLLYKLVDPRINLSKGGD